MFTKSNPDPKSANRTFETCDECKSKASCRNKGECSPPSSMLDISNAIKTVAAEKRNGSGPAAGPRGIAVNDLRALYDVIRMESRNGCSDALHTINYFVTHRRAPLSEYELDFIKALNFAAIRESEARIAREYIL